MLILLICIDFWLESTIVVKLLSFLLLLASDLLLNPLLLPCLLFLNSFQLILLNSSELVLVLFVLLIVHRFLILYIGIESSFFLCSSLFKSVSVESFAFLVHIVEYLPVKVRIPLIIVKVIGSTVFSRDWMLLISDVEVHVLAVIETSILIIRL